MRPSLFGARLLVALAFLVPAVTTAQTQPQPRPAPDSAADTSKSPFIIRGVEVPFRVDLRLEPNWSQLRNLKCTSAELFQASTGSSCRSAFPLTPTVPFTFAFRSNGTILDRVHIDIDYDKEREFSASQILSAWYEGPEGSKLRRVDVGNISFAPPPSRFVTSTLPAGNYGLQITNQFGPMQLRTIAAGQAGNVVQNKLYWLGGQAQQQRDAELEDIQLERLRFFFTVDPALFGRSFPNVDILNRSQLDRLRAALPDTLRPTRVLLYRLQFGAQPIDPNGPRFRVRGDPAEARQTYTLLREGVDYYMDRSNLWFALVQPLSETNERLVVAYYVKINGRDTVWTSTGGTPDLKFVPNKDQVANLVMDPNVGPSSPAFRNEIRSVYRVAGENLVRQTLKVRVVTGSGLLEHPLAGNDPTFLAMFGLAQSQNPADFDYENRLWPRRGDGPFNLGAGAPDVRNGLSLDAAQIIRDYFVVFPSLRPFSNRPAGLVVTGNPTNDPIYSTPGEYLNSPQHPASVYRLHFTFETTASDNAGMLALGATQMRPGSERIVVDGRSLVRDLDYRMNYDLGQVEFMRPDTLFRLRRRVEASFEENPIIAATTTALAGMISEVRVPHGLLTFTAMNQWQGTTADLAKPQLGFQGGSTLTAGATGQFAWDLPAVTSFLGRLPFSQSKAPARLLLSGEIATSRPQFGARNANQAYIDAFDGDGGSSIALGDVAWHYSSMPAYGHTLRSTLGGSVLEVNRASTLVWQSAVRTPSGQLISFTRSSIDPAIRLVGSGAEQTEQVLWLSLLPLSQAGAFQPSTRKYNWTVGNTPSGPRWRSIQTVLSPSGVDFTPNEQLEFWALVDTSNAGRAKNPKLVLDFGDVSENSLAFAPETLTVRHNPNGTIDSLFTGRRLLGFDTLNTERDKFSLAFNADANDTGLPGDVVDTLVVVDGATVTKLTNVRICRATPSVVKLVGDQNANCTVGNNRLDEEDIDLDNALNFNNASRERERLLRYVVDLGQSSRYVRVGGAYRDSLIVNGVATPRTRNWVLISIPLKSPTDSLNDVNRQRIRALRLSIVSPNGVSPDEPTQIAIAELRRTGAPWLNRSSQTLAGIGEKRTEGGFVVLSTISTADSSGALVYQPPPGIVDEAESQAAQFSGGRTTINESSMRVQAGGMNLYRRAEAYQRSATGPQFFLGYEQLRIWGRGRGNGWGQNGDLQAFVKVGRDENNFYLRRFTTNAGNTQAAWTEAVVELSRFKALRDRIQREYLAGKSESIQCTGLDSALVAATPVPVGVIVHRFAACEDGYIAYTIDPAVTAPNLAAVQEVAVGIVRVGSSTLLIPSDTLELWVDDIRLTKQVNTPGRAGQVNANLIMGELGDIRFNLSNRDPNFRQIGEQPNFLGQKNVDMAMTLQLHRLLPKSIGLAVPLTITRTSVGNDPLYLSRSDISGNDIPGLRKPKNDLTTYSVSVRRTTPISTPWLAPIFDNLGATATYVSGVDRTEFQDGNAKNLSVSLDYLITSDSARIVQIPIPFRSGSFRWNPTQFRLTSGIVKGDDKRVSFVLPSSSVGDQPATSTAKSRLWRNGSVLELRPTPGMSARWEVESLRDFRDYRDTAFDFAGVSRRVTVQPGFERERTIATSFSIAPVFSSWFRPRADFGNQYGMLRDPNIRSFSPLPGVLGVDSVLATRDTMSLARILALPRRMTAAQTTSIGALVNIPAAFVAYSGDSTLARRIGRFFSPVDVSYTRSLLSALDASPLNAPLGLQLGLAGPASFRRVNGVDATSSGQTGTFDANGSLLLPYGVSFVNRYRRTTTLNWIARPDSTLAHVDGGATQFPDVALRWAFRPTGFANLSAADASIGYVKSTVNATLPNLFTDVAPEVRHTVAEQFPLNGTIAFAGSTGLSAHVGYSLNHRTDSLPGSIARTRGNEMSIDAGRAFRVPASLGLGFKNDLRTRIGYQQLMNNTVIVDPAGSFSSRLQDNGRRAFNMTADTNVDENATLTFHGSYIVTYDNNLNHRFAQTVFSIVLQISVFGVR